MPKFDWPDYTVFISGPVERRAGRSRCIGICRQYFVRQVAKIDPFYGKLLPGFVMHQGYWKAEYRRMTTAASGGQVTSPPTRVTK